MISTLQSGRWASPMMAAGMIRIGEVANRIFDGSVNRGVAHATGAARWVLTVAWEMQSCSEAMWALSFQIPFQQQLVAGAGGYFAPYIRNYMARSGAPDDIGIQVAVKDRLNALRNPYAHLHEPEITYDSVRESLMLWDPIRYSETCPSSDGAFAMVLGDEATADAAVAEGRRGFRGWRCVRSRRWLRGVIR